MDNSTFTALHARCLQALQDYFAQAEKTSTMLGRCTPHPMSFDERMALFAQEIVEHDAYDKYLRLKRSLHDVARTGYAPAEDGNLRKSTAP